MSPGFQTFATGTLPEPFRSRIAAAAKSHGQGSAVTQGNLGGEVGLMLVGVLLFGAAAFFVVTSRSHSIDRMQVVLFVVGAALIAFAGFRLRRRFGSQLGTFSLSTPAYYIESDGGMLKAWDRSLAVGIRFHHNYGRYQVYLNTVMIFEYPGQSLAIGDYVAPIDGDAELLARSAIFREHLALWRAAKAARERGAFAQLPGAELLPP